MLCDSPSFVPSGSRTHRAPQKKMLFQHLVHISDRMTPRAVVSRRGTRTRLLEKAQTFAGAPEGDTISQEPGGVGGGGVNF